MRVSDREWASIVQKFAWAVRRFGRYVWSHSMRIYLLVFVLCMKHSRQNDANASEGRIVRTFFLNEVVAFSRDFDHRENLLLLSAMLISGIGERDREFNTRFQRVFVESLHFCGWFIYFGLTKRRRNIADWMPSSFHAVPCDAKGESVERKTNHFAELTLIWPICHLASARDFLDNTRPFMTCLLSIFRVYFRSTFVAVSKTGPVKNSQV